MKKGLKIFSGIVAILVLLVIVLVVLANVLITPERVRETLLPLAEKNLHRKIELGDIAVSLFSGIEIQGLTLYEQDNQEIFVSTDLVRLKYQLLPLLAMKVVVDEVRLEKPVIRIVRMKGGLFNFSDLVGDAGSAERQAKTAAQEAPQKAKSGAPISLLVSNFLLKDGQLTFIDHVLNDKAPYRYEISDLQIAAKGVSLSGDVPLTLQCRLNGSPLTLDGHVSLQNLGGNFDVALEKLDVVAFKPYFKDALPGKLGGLSLSLESAISGTLDNVAAKGSITFADLDLLLNALPEAPLRNAALKVNYDIAFTKTSEQLQLKQLDLDYNGIKVKSKGEVASLLAKPHLNLTLTVPELQIRDAFKAVPQNIVGDVISLDPAGAITAEVVVSGTVDDGTRLLKSAQVDLKDVQATAGGQRPAFTGRLSLAGDHLTSEGLQVRLGDNNAAIDLEVQHLFATPVMVRADVSSERFLIEPLLKGGAAPVAVTNQGPSQTSQKGTGGDELGPFDIPVQAKGTIKVSEALYKALTIKNFIANYELKDNVFNLSRLDGEVAGGSFSNSARIDLGKKGLAYSATLGLRTIQADPLLTAFVPKAAGGLMGAMDLAFVLNGRGTQWKSLSRNLSGDGNLLVADGRLINPGLVNGLSAFLQLSELKDLRFDNFTGQFKIENGKVKLNSQLLSSTLKLFPKGTIGLDGSLDLGLDTRLSPELSAKLDKKGGVASYLADQDGWTRMPLLLRGDFASPSFGLDPKGVQEQASKAIGKELGKQIDKLFNRSKSVPSEAGQQPPTEGDGTKVTPEGDLLQKSLQKLFGN